MIAVTVISPSYRIIGNEAVERVKRFTKLPVEVVECSDDQGFLNKLSLHEHFRGHRVMFFDADWWMLRPFDFEKMRGVWFGVKDPCVFQPHSFCFQDCEKHGLERDTYINTGMFVCDLAQPEHREVFVRARDGFQMRQEGVMLCKDVTDQYHINKALKDLNEYVSLLPFRFNFYKKAVDWGAATHIPRHIVGLHAAGYVLHNKLPRLREQAATFTEEERDIQPLALYDLHQRIFES